MSSQSLPNHWLVWFIGFAEGDGAILKDSHSNRLRFILTQKERAVLDSIQNTFNFGTVRSFSQGRNRKVIFYRWVVEDFSHICLLAYLFNGNLAIVHRIEQLSKWISVINTKVDHTLVCITTPVSISFKDAWLSGFTDAEGCFNVNITANNRYTLGHVVQMRFLLDQKDYVILSTVQKLFGFGKVTLRLETENVYRYYATGFTRMTTVRMYFSQFPLRTKKSLSLEKWLQIHDMILNKDHLTLEGLNQIRRRQKTININNSQMGTTGLSLVLRKTKI